MQAPLWAANMLGEIRKSRNQTWTKQEDFERIFFLSQCCLSVFIATFLRAISNPDLNKNANWITLKLYQHFQNFELIYDVDEISSKIVDEIRQQEGGGNVWTYIFLIKNKKKRGRRDEGGGDV